MRTTSTIPERVLTLANFASTPGLKPSNIDMNKWVNHIRAKGFKGFLEETIDERFPNVADKGFLTWFIEESAKTDVEPLRPLRTDDEGSRLHRPAARDQVPDAERHAGTRSARRRPAQYEVYRKHVPHCEFIVYDGLAAQHHRFGAGALRRGPAAISAEAPGVLSYRQ